MCECVYVKETGTTQRNNREAILYNKTEKVLQENG